MTAGAAHNRRAFLAASASGIASLGIASRSRIIAADESPSREKLPVAAVVTVYRQTSHADVIVGKILDGYRQDGGIGPDLKLVSLYVDQTPDTDLSQMKSMQHGFRICKTIDEALTFGTDQLQVAGVLSIGEHGDYERTPDTHQRKYPRRRFFDDIVAVFRRCGAVVPVFNDKHLAYNWSDAWAMYRSAKELKVPFLAGSSVPVAWRNPPLELPIGSEIEAAISIGYGGFEDYGFHALEGHQCMIERRRGGESGVTSVRALMGDDIRDAIGNSELQQSLFRAALKAISSKLDDNATWTKRKDAAAFALTHRDNMRSAVIMANGLAGHFAFAVKLKDRSEIIATHFKLQDGAPYGHFAYLVKAIEETIHARRPVYPVERTLLTTGILDRAMHSIANGGESYSTPELNITYQPSDWPFANHPAVKLQLPND